MRSLPKFRNSATRIPYTDAMPDFIDRTGLLLIRDHKLLGARTRGKTTFYIPGGKREGNESDEECLAREIKEELGARVIPGSVIPYKLYVDEADGKPAGTMLHMMTMFASLESEPVPSSEIEEIAWFGYGEVDRFGKIDRQIFEDLYTDNYIR